MKLVWDKPTKSFRQSFFLSFLSFFSCPLHTPYRFPSFHSNLYPPIGPSPLFHLQIFLPFSFPRIRTGEGKRKGGREKSDTFSPRFASFSIPNFTLSQNEASSLPFVPPPIPDLPIPPSFPIRLVSDAFQGKASSFDRFVPSSFFPSPFFFFPPPPDPGPLTLFWYLSFVCIEVYVPSCRLARLTCKCNH